MEMSIQGQNNIYMGILSKNRCNISLHLSYDWYRRKNHIKPLKPTLCMLDA